MTIQIDDKFDYINNEYSIISTENGLLFEPNDYGFSPVALSTACWRGHYCRYSIENGSFILTQLNIGLDTDNPPVWRGLKASGGKCNVDYWTYEYVNLLIKYSGGIIIGRDLIESYFNILGFYQPHCWKHVIELIFDNGRLVNKISHDRNMDKARKIIHASSQVYKKSIGYFEEPETITIKLPVQTDIKSFTLLVKDIASKYKNSSIMELFNLFRTKGFIELDKKLYYGEYRELSSCFERKGYKNIILTAYSTDCDTHLDPKSVIAQHPDSTQLLELYNKYGYDYIHLL